MDADERSRDDSYDDSEDTSDDDNHSCYSEYNKSISSGNSSSQEDDDNDDDDDYSIASIRHHRIKQIMVVTVSSILILVAVASGIVAYDRLSDHDGLESKNENRTLQVPSNPPSTSQSPEQISTLVPTSQSMSPTQSPSILPTTTPTLSPSISPSALPTFSPSILPTTPPTLSPSFLPSTPPTLSPSILPTTPPTLGPSVSPSTLPTSVPSPTPSQSPTICVDDTDWKDKTGDNCEEYRKHRRDLDVGEYDGYYWCEVYGYLENNGKSARTACCICGGGMHLSAYPSTSPAPSLITVSPQPTVSECEDEDEYEWYDYEGSPCSWYNLHPKWCDTVGDHEENLLGKSPQEACCVCGGGKHIPSPVTLSPSGPPSQVAPS